MATALPVSSTGQVTHTSGSIHKLPKGVLLVLEEEDLKYVTRLGSAFNGIKTKVLVKCPELVSELIIIAKRAGLDAICTTRLDLLKKLLPEGPVRKSAKISNYAGSIIPWDETEFLILNPMKQLQTVTYGNFLATHYISKLVHPQRWRENSEFTWKLIKDEKEFQVAKAALSSCDLIATDTETARWNASIRMVGYCGVHVERNQSVTYVIPLNSIDAVRWMREINALRVPKVMQNGKYDCAYFARYNAPCWGYMYDTKNMLHAWYAEMPKDLGFASAFFIRNSMYWKDLSDSGDMQTQYLYNALDCWATAEAALAWLAAAPAWAKNNYVMEFSTVPAAHMCEMTGIRRNVAKLNKFADESEERQRKQLESLGTMTGHKNFNPSSHVQVKKLMKALGGNEKECESSDEKHLDALAYKHPLNERIFGTILEYRGDRKETSTYLSRGENAKEFGPDSNRRILYSINPDGTDTGRNSSKEHHFWCGLQIQNIGADSDTKETLEADPGWELWEADYSQAEDRGVANKSGDPALLEIFSSGVDSHSYKASMFFGIPYEEIYQPASTAYWDHEKRVMVPAQEGKVLRKDIRQLGKKVNHGANYNMGAKVLVATMGPKKIREAQRILKLPPHWDLLGVANFLLNAYEKAFPTVKKEYYAAIIKEVTTTGMLKGDTGWVRFCFGDPKASKMVLNSYVAHVTQSLNAMILNEAFVKVFNHLGFNPNFKLLAQIHDSILFMVRIGHEYLAEEVQKIMLIPKQITDCKGVTRTMSVPVDIKKLGSNWRGTDE